jgi:hypothetical protein
MIEVSVGNCPFCDQENILVLPEPVVKRLIDWIDAGRPGYIQNWFPDLSAAQREAVLTSSHSECFDKAFPDD